MSAKVDKKKIADAGMAALVAGLKGAKAVLDTSSIPGASAVFSVILSCIDEAQKASRNADILKTVRGQVDDILAILEPLNAVSDPQQTQDISDALGLAALDLVKELSQRADTVKEKTTHSLRPAWMTRGSDEEALQDFVRSVEDDLKRFQIAQGNRIERHLQAIRADVQVIKENTREIKRRGTATEKETTAILTSAQAIQDRTDAIGATTAATKVLTMEEAAEAREREWDRVLDNVRRAPLASYNAERPGTVTGCSSETRIELLEDIYRWIADPEADRVYWLRERAGFGKTAIAVSVAERAAKRGELAASFFFSHQVSDLNHASLFFPTIAFQLALFDQRRYRQLFAEAVKDSPDAGSARLGHQVESLFVKPLQRVESTSRPIVIVIDALDECNREHAQELVDGLIKALDPLSLPIRIVITSRPEHHLITAFKSVGVSARSINDTSEDDVETYLRKALAEIPHKLGLSDMERDWISEEEIAILVERAAGLFVYASTAIRFIGDPVALNPRKHLEILLREDETQAATYQPYEPLDRLYKRILDLATNGRQDLVEEAHIVLGGRIVIKAALTLAVLARFLAISVSDARRTLVKLQSVTVCPGANDGEVTFHHASFKDFLLDRSRCGPIYFIETMMYHHRVAIQSMQIISTSEYGPKVEAALASDNYYERDIEDMPEELNYATSNVYSHIAKAPKDDTLRKAFDIFFQQGSLWWLEGNGAAKQVKDLTNIYAWRIAEANPPNGLIVLQAFSTLQPLSCRGNVWANLRWCNALSRKELRRYFRLSSLQSGRPTDVDLSVANLHRHIRRCIDDIPSDPEEPSPSEEERDKWLIRVSVKCAEDLKAILDDFMLSMGNLDEVDADHRRTLYLRSRVLEDFYVRDVLGPSKASRWAEDVGVKVGEENAVERR